MPFNQLPACRHGAPSNPLHFCFHETFHITKMSFPTLTFSFHFKSVGSKHCHFSICQPVTASDPRTAPPFCPGEDPRYWPERGGPRDGAGPAGVLLQQADLGGDGLQPHSPLHVPPPQALPEPGLPSYGTAAFWSGGITIRLWAGILCL